MSSPNVKCLRDLALPTLKARAHPDPVTSPAARASTTAPAKVLDLASAKGTVATQIELLSSNRDEDFRKTFAPGVDVTDAVVLSCKQRVVDKTVRPDWEMAEDAIVDGLRVRRVSMFSKSMTAFREVAP